MDACIIKALQAGWLDGFLLEGPSARVGIVALRLIVAKCSCQSYKLRVASYELQVMCYNLRVTSYELQVTSHEAHELRVTSYASHMQTHT